MLQLLYCQEKSHQFALDGRLDGPQASMDTVAKRKVLAFS